MYIDLKSVVVGGLLISQISRCPIDVTIYGMGSFSPSGKGLRGRKIVREF
jgi:hypothetical protein